MKLALSTLTTFTFAVSALFLASCATLLGPRDVEIPLSKIQQSLENRFPFNNRYLELLDISITNPKVTLQSDTNRIMTSMDASIAPPFLQRSWKGNFAVSGNPKFDPSQNALVLGEPRVEQFAVDGLDPLYANQVKKIGSLLAEHILANAPLYTFQPDELRHAGTSYILSKITTKPDSLVVTFEPAK